MLEIDEQHGGGSLLSDRLMGTRTATSTTNRRVGLQEVSTHHERRSGALRHAWRPQLTLRNPAPHAVGMVNVLSRALARYVK